MDTYNNTRCTPAAPDVEVVMELDPDGRFEACINGGPLDGERFVDADVPPDELRRRVVGLAQIAARSLRR